MATQLQIANRALQKLGATALTSLADNSRNAASVNRVFDIVFKAELEEHTWRFAIKRVQLAADATAPAFGRSFSYPLPSDFIRLVEPDPKENYNDVDWEIEGTSIMSDWASPLNLRYVAAITDYSLLTPLFVEALATRLAWELAEELTQSNTKKSDLKDDYDKLVRRAKRSNDIQRVAAEAPTDTWITARD